MKLSNILILLAVLVVLGGVYYAVSRPDPTPPAKPKMYIWSIADEDIEHIVISLPRQGQSQAFVKISQGDEIAWYFDDPLKSPVDPNRWSGGIPLILSGPSADRIISDYATDEQLAVYGLLQPSMQITLSSVYKETLEIDVGDSTPNGYNYYIKSPVSNAVATVDSSWYQAFQHLVTDSPGEA